MKKVLLLLSLLFSVLSYGQAPPPGINYQAVARNSSGNALISTPLDVQFTIWDAASGGSQLFQETHTGLTTNVYGLFTTVIGSVNTPGFNSINWAGGNRYLEVSVDDGSGLVSMGRLQMQSVPYALYAGNAGGGLMGATGPTGSASTVAGPVGPTGATGDIGATGAPSTIAGPTGTNGIDGATGVTGAAITNITDNGNGTLTIVYGASGTVTTGILYGPTGATGNNGIPGATGNNGIDGTTGATGNNGIDGATGATGSNGLDGITGPTGLAGADGATGNTGPSGTSILNSDVDPNAGIGSFGDFYINTTSNTIWGPKTANWPASGVSLVGPSGAIGATGLTGASVLNGTSVPSSGLGSDGDFYINTSTNFIYGPKSGGIWPGAGTSLVGPTGSTGAANIAGTINRLIKFTGAATGGNSQLFDNGTNVGVGTITPGFKLEVSGTGKYSGPLTIGTYTLPSTDGTVNQVLKTNGAGVLNWSADLSNAYTAGTGLSLAANVFSLANTAVISGTYGSPTTVPQIIVDPQGRITNASNIPITGIVPPGTATQTLYNTGAAWSPTNIIRTDGVNIGMGSVASLTPNRLVEMQFGGLTTLLVGNSMASGTAIAANITTTGEGLNISNNGGGRAAAFNFGNVTVNNGFLGIGISAPSNLLDVESATSGAVKIADGTQGPGKVFTSDAAGVGTWQPIGGGPAPWTKTGTAIYPSTLTDFVGIGTNSPGAPLHLFGTMDPLEILIENTGGAFKTGLHIKTASHEWAVGQAGTPNFQITDLTSNQPRLNIDPSGNVGIGTTNPTSGRLVVEGGNLIVSQSGLPNQPNLNVVPGFSGSNGVAINAMGNANTDLYLQTGSGNVGIGTLTPNILASERALTISANAYIGNHPVGIELIGGTNAGAAEIGKLSFLQYFGNTELARIQTITSGGSTAQGQLLFYTRGGAGLTEAMRIDPSSNVGIGLNAPASKLHSAGQIRTGIPVGGLGGALATNGSLLFYNSTNGNTINIQTGVPTAPYTLTLPIDDGNPGQFLTTNGTGILSWSVAGGSNNWVNSGAGSTLNIGSQFPGAQIMSSTLSFYSANLQLTYNGPALAAADVLGSVSYGDNQGSAAQAGIWAHRDAASAGATDLPTRLVFYTTPDGSGSMSEAMRISNSGNVGIGCTAPAYKLHVTGNVGVVGTIFASVASVTGGVVACSDIRYKKEINPLPNALTNVLKLQGVSYYWKVNEFPEKNFTNEKQIGVIAQEIEKIYPELVITDKDGYKAVDYSRLTPILVEAIKEQQKQIEALKSQLNNNTSDSQKAKIRLQQMETENASLKSDIDLIKLQLGIGVETKK